MYIDIHFLIILSILLFGILVGLVVTVIRQRKIINDYIEMMIISDETTNKKRR